MTNGEKFKEVFGFGADGSRVIAVNAAWWDCEFSDFPIIFYSERLEIERAFNEWADKNEVAKVPNALVGFLEINGLLNTEKTVEWCRVRRQKKQTEEGE